MKSEFKKTMVRKREIKAKVRLIDNQSTGGIVNINIVYYCKQIEEEGLIVTKNSQEASKPREAHVSSVKEEQRSHAMDESMNHAHHMTHMQEPKEQLHDEKMQSVMDQQHHEMDMDHEMHMGHAMHGSMDHSMHMGNFKQKFWVSLILAFPIVLLSPMMGLNLPFQFQFPGSDWLVLILATILFFYGGQPFLAGAKSELRQKNPAMMTLIAMGITVSYVYSVYSFIATTFLGKDVMNFFWELATLIVIMLLGHWIEMNAVMNASDALQKLAELLPDKVTRLVAGKEEVVSLQAVHTGDKLIVRSGDKMPTDGKILSGQSIVDESAVTGESRGVQKNPQDLVIGGSVNGEGTLTIQVTGTGEEGYLAKVMTMVRRAQAEKSKLEALSDKVAKWLFYVALTVGILAFISWLVLTDLPTALDRMVTVFVIACPHALGLAIPLVIARSTSIAAQNGLLLKNRNALENSHDLSMILLDKTGTLTQGTFAVTGIEQWDNQVTSQELLQYIGALEKTANHPIAVGMMRYLKAQGVEPFEAKDTQTITGVGLSGMVHSQKVTILNENALTESEKQSLDPSKWLHYQEQGNTISFVKLNDDIVGLIALGDEIKPEAKAFIQALHNRQIEPVMLTGDNQEAAAKVAGYLGITQFYAGLLPDGKEKIVAQFVHEGKRVAMVGDGINDAPSLARATIGIAIGAGTDVAIDSADVVLTNSNPEDILHFLDLAKVTRRKMIQNLWWGAGYNIFAIPLAAGILAPIGIVLNPAVGAILMSLSTVIVAMNAMTLSMKKEANGSSK